MSFCWKVAQVYISIHRFAKPKPRLSSKQKEKGFREAAKYDNLSKPLYYFALDRRTTVSTWLDRPEMMSDSPCVRGNCSTPEMGEISLTSNPRSKARQFSERGRFIFFRYYIIPARKKCKICRCLNPACLFGG